MASLDIDASEAQLIKVLSANPDGLSDRQLKEAFGEDGVQGMLTALNHLIQESRVQFYELNGGGVHFKLIEEQTAAKLQGLTPEMMMVYHEIERAGNSGIWNRDIKLNTNIQQTVLSKALKELERRSLIKSVKSIHQKTKKIWMLFELTPSTEITGGPWYTDNEFDHEFVNEIARLVEGQIRDAWEKRAEPTSLQQIDASVKSSGVSTEQLSTEHIKQILSRLLFDLKIETLTLNPEMQRKYKDIGPWYRPAAHQVRHYDRFTSIPCGVCPVFSQCTPGGVISPETCKYFTQWLDDSEAVAAAMAQKVEAGASGEDDPSSMVLS